jgi:hypothetical protein
MPTAQSNDESGHRDRKRSAGEYFPSEGLLGNDDRPSSRHFMQSFFMSYDRVKGFTRLLSSLQSHVST